LYTVHAAEGELQVDMRPSKVLAALRKGGTVFCTKMNLADARAVEIAAAAGFECIWADMEHVPNDFSTIEKQVLAAKAGSADIMVRVARGGYSDYIRPLEMDATGIMVPHIMDLDDARNVVRMTRFHPIGRRPLDGGNSDGAFSGVELKDYIAQANRERFLVVQIEDPEPLEDLEEIATLDGIDMLFFGPGDFSQGIGAPGEWSHPLIVETRRRIAETAIRHGKFAGTVGTLDNMDELIGMGYRFINIGADVLGLRQYYDDLVGGLKKRLAQRLK
jgi:4-hydroxy-2-oxoheptanedioate aldolase